MTPKAIRRHFAAHITAGHIATTVSLSDSPFQGYGQRKLDLNLDGFLEWTLPGLRVRQLLPDGPDLSSISAPPRRNRPAGPIVAGRTVELTAGWLQHQTRANWKLLAENETDGYHPQFVHGSIFGVTGSPIGALYSDTSTAVTRDWARVTAK